MNAVDELNALLGIGPPKPRLPITLQRSGYEAIKVLGKGSFGQAYLIFHKSTNRYYVAKHVNLSKMDQRQRKEARNEISILQQMKHPNVVKYEESVEQGSDLYIVMEYADGGDLYSHINKVKANGAMMTEDQVLNLFVQVAMAIKYMHDRKVIHRDIKPQNVFLTKSRVVKLGDFGISTVLNHTMAMATTLCGTPCYFSPELCDSKPYNNKSDVWALGVLLYEMASLELPFDSPNMKRLMDDIRRVNPVRKRSFSDGLWSLIQSMLIKDPFKRPDMDGVLAHPTIVKAMPRIANLLAAGAPPPSSVPVSPRMGGGGSKEDERMLAMWKAKKEREAAAAAGSAPQQPHANNNALPGIHANRPMSNAPRAVLPTPPAAPPLVTPARGGVGAADMTPSSALPSAIKATPSSAASPYGGNNNAAAAAPPMSAAAVERAKRDEEYRKLREEMAKIEENRRQRMERDRQQEAVVDEYLKRREEQLEKQRAAEAAEAELKRAEAIRVMKENEAREQRIAAEARARDIAAAEAKARIAREAAEKAKLEAEKQRQAVLLAEKQERERREKEDREAAAERERRARQQMQYHPEVMMAEGPAHRNYGEEEVIEDETEVGGSASGGGGGINAVIRNMQTLHERSVHLGHADIVDEVGPVDSSTATPIKQRSGGGKASAIPPALDQTIIDETAGAGNGNGGGHTFEDPMGTRVNVEEIQLASPAKKMMGASLGFSPSTSLGAPQSAAAAASSSSKSSTAVVDDDDDEPIHGTCLCGKVEFSGYLSYVYGSFTCTCNLCKRFTGSALGVSWLHLPAVLFPEIVKPSDALRNFSVDNDRSHCYFCRKCGASIAMEHPGIDGCVVSKAALDQKSDSALNRNQRTARN